MKPSFGTRFENGGQGVQDEIVEFAASKLICGQSENMQNGLNDDQKLGMENRLTPFCSRLIDILFSRSACMAVRLSLEFNSTALESQQRERLQVAKHMHICIKVNDGFETIVSVAPSEPILAEGARLLMSNPKFNLPKSLLRELQVPGLAKTNTRAVSVHEFFKNLLNSDDYAELLDAMPSRQKNESVATFRETFSKSIKIQDFRMVNQKYLWMFIARGAAILCANNEVGIDVVIPFLYYDDKLARWNVSAMLYQSKNDRSFSITPKRRLFDGMNHFSVGVFDSDDTPLPVIRMVLALSSAKSGVTIMEPERTRYRRKAKKKKGKKSPPYTSYDIWCAGAFAKTFAVINEAEEETYKQLLKVCSPFPEAYTPRFGVVGEEEHKRSMNPMVTRDVDHWGAFEAVKEDEEMDEYDYDDVESEEE